MELSSNLIHFPVFNFLLDPEKGSKHCFEKYSFLVVCSPKTNYGPKLPITSYLINYKVINSQFPRDAGPLLQLLCCRAYLRSSSILFMLKYRSEGHIFA